MCLLQAKALESFPSHYFCCSSKTALLRAAKAEVTLRVLCPGKGRHSLRAEEGLHPIIWQMNTIFPAPVLTPSPRLCSSLWAMWDWPTALCTAHDIHTRARFCPFFFSFWKLLRLEWPKKVRLASWFFLFSKVGTSQLLQTTRGNAKNSSWWVFNVTGSPVYFSQGSNKKAPPMHGHDKGIQPRCPLVAVTLKCSRKNWIAETPIQM